VFTFDLGGLLAGFVVASQLGVFQLSPWAIAVYPAILGAKGVIYGLFSSRLGTALHLGTANLKFLNNTKNFHKLIHATIVTTLVVSVVMSSISVVFGTLLWGVTLENSLDIVAVIMSTMTLGLTFTLVTIKVAFVTFEKGLDPDITVYPIMSTVTDLFITLCYTLILNLFFLFSLTGKSIIIALIVLHLVSVLYILPKSFRAQDFRKNLKESLLILLLVSVIVNITGTVLKNISLILNNRGKEIYTVYPALMDTIGDVGFLVGSTATTKLSLGLLRPSLFSLRKHGKTILSVWSASILIFLVLAVLSPLVNGTLTFFTFSNLFFTLLVANVIAVIGIVLLSYGLSILTFQKGLDPDNLVVPLESSFADTLMTVALLAALVLVG